MPTMMIQSTLRRRRLYSSSLNSSCDTSSSSPRLFESSASLTTTSPTASFFSSTFVAVVMVMSDGLQCSSEWREWGRDGAHPSALVPNQSWPRALISAHVGASSAEHIAAHLMACPPDGGGDGGEMRLLKWLNGDHDGCGGTERRSLSTSAIVVMIRMLMDWWRGCSETATADVRHSFIRIYPELLPPRLPPSSEFGVHKVDYSVGDRGSWYKSSSADESVSVIAN